MREILFRGKCIDTGNWIHGLLWRHRDNAEEIYISRFPLKVDEERLDQVYPDTVGQYTGLNDKNGVKIFEGDIVRLPDIYRNELAVVKYCSSAFKACNEAFAYQIWGVEVIGNIYDNPELLHNGEPSDICKSTNLKCVKCNPGPCDNRKEADNEKNKF